MSIRALLSFFHRSKASVEPVSRTDDLGEVLVKREHTFTRIFEGQPLFGGASLLDLNPYEGPPSRFEPSPKPQHPLAPELAPPPLDWASWSFMQRETFRRGWSFARYAVRHSDRMACVFGIVRGPWGICKMDFYICGPGTYDTLNAITHLPSGMGCGLFTDQESAAVACDIAARLKDDWETLDPYADARVTSEALHRMHGAWAAAGLTQCATQAHTSADRETSPLPIWFQDYSTVVAGRPEGKLS